MGSVVKWYGDQELSRLRKAAGDAIRRSAVLLQTRARLLASRPAERIRRKRHRTTTAGPPGSGYTEFIASRPGQPPALRTGFGRRNILMEFVPDQLLARVGPSKQADYMAYLELGTQHISPRPWLRTAVEQSRPAIRALIETALHKAVK